ncbi:MAG: hypothetical protein J3Q66DRAFT_320956 [Benniella sp.]|nr:MAG: hypothetical protein J3Q66DRAFT_320956 [Benniella sp.]
MITTNSSFAMWRLPLLLHTWPRPASFDPTKRSRSLLESFQSEFSMTMIITGKNLEDEEECEIKDTANGAAHRSNLTATTMPEAVRDKIWPLATTVPSAPSMGATTSTAAPMMDNKTVTREQHAPISAARPVDPTTATDPLRNPKWGSTTVRATGGDTSQVVDHQPYQSQYRHQTTTEPVIHKGMVAAEGHEKSQLTIHADD